MSDDGKTEGTRPWTMAQIKKAKALRDDGWRLKEIARELGRPSADSICRILAKHAPYAKRWRTWTPEDDEKFISLRASGVRYKQIAKILQRTLKAVQRRAQYLGVVRRRDK